ncbi:PRC-barrel domain-containing protein [Bacillus marinisedimentorum]|uniref:PRC-barrel domain-containing protein n=1 Tax=Bacillus marinisedimentorum TaxID=1821260 RepID=UPI000872DB81|nr:PRC-barrel domain-containing protein [Bacillus marinisedimentorum]
MEKGKDMLKKPLLTKDGGEKLGMLKDFYLNTDQEPFVSYLAYEHTVEMPREDVTPNQSYDTAVDMTAAQGMNTFNIAPSQAMEEKTQSMVKQYIIKGDFLLENNHDELVVDHSGFELDGSRVEPGLSYHELITYDAVTRGGETVGRVHDVLFDGTEVAGLEIKTADKLLRHDYKYVPAASGMVVENNRIQLDFTQEDKMADDPAEL